MVSCPSRRAHPLDVSRRADSGVGGHRVARGVVQEVRPLVDVTRPGLDRVGPGLAPFDAGDAAGGQHAQDLVHRDLAQVFGHQQVDQVVDVREPAAREPFDRHPAFAPQRFDVASGPLDVGGVGVQAVHQVTIGSGQRGGQSPVAATEVDDQPAPDAGGFKDLPGGSLGVGRDGRRTR